MAEDTEIEVDVDRAAALADTGAQLLDVREDDEVEAGHIPGITHVPLGQLGAQLAQVRQDSPVVVVCLSGARSLMAAQALRGAGYEAYSLAGGTAAWHAAGRPLEPEDGHVAGH